MLAKEFLEEIEETYKKYFPKSKISATLDTSLYRSIGVRIFIANTIEECNYNIWENDMFKISFTIVTENGELSKDIGIDSELPSNLVLTCDRKTYTIKPTNKYMTYDSRVIAFRKTKGSGTKLIKTLDKFFSNLQTSLFKDIEQDNIHENHIGLLMDKLNKCDL